MSIITYQPTIDRIISKYEGGYGWNKKDPGGPTKYGITCYDLAEHLGQTMDSMSRWAPIVQDMTLATAEQIYSTKYATAIRYSDLPPGPDACMLDYGINSGSSRAVRSARAILGVKGGGAMDQALLDAIKKTDPSTFIKAMCAERLHFMHGIRGGSAWAEFGGGWGARVADLQTYCLHLAQGGTPAAAPAANDNINHTVQPKAIHVGKTATTPTAGGAVATGGTAVGLGFEWYYVLGAVVLTVIAGVAYEAFSANKAANANSVVVLPPNIVLPTVPAPPVVKAA
jgi:lysozyme family protein